MKRLLPVGLFLTIGFSLTAQNVGIGENNPASKATIKGNLSVGSGYSTTAAPTNGAIIEGQVGIGVSSPNANAALDVTSTNKGMLIPRVALVTTTNPISGTKPDGLMVYNTSTTGTYSTPGIYMWSNTAGDWVRIITNTTLSSSLQNLTNQAGGGLGTFSYNGSSAVQIGITSQGVQTGMIANDAVTTTQIAPNTITSADMGPNSVDLSSGVVTNLLPINRGGTNTNTLGSGGSIAYSNGSGYAFSPVGTSGQVLVSGGTGQPTWSSVAALNADHTPGTGLSGSVYDGSSSQTWNVAYGATAGTAVQGNQTATITAGSGLTGGISADALGDGFSSTLNIGAGTGIAVNADDVAFDYSATLAANPALSGGQTKFATTGLLFEGATADANEGLLTTADPTADQTWTLPNASGTIALTSNIGITTLNGLNTTTQTFANGTGGSSPGWSSAGSTHTLNIPMASTAGVVAGLLSNADYTTLTNKPTGTGTVNYVARWTAANTLGTGVLYDNGTNVGVGTNAPVDKLDVRDAMSVNQINFRNVGGGDDSDPYSLRKVSDAANSNHLDLQLNDDYNEEFRIYGNSCVGYGCAAVSGNLYHFFRADGTTYHLGNVGINNTAPAAKLHIVDGTPTGVQALDANTKIAVDAASGGFLEFRNTADNNTFSGMLFTDNNLGGYVAFRNYSDDILHIGGYGAVTIETGATNTVGGKAEVMRATSGGLVGIGVTAPAEKLHVSNNIRADGIVYWGNGLARTETRTDAGLQGNAGARSGFYENDGSTVTNYPSGASGWWHLLDVRHSNSANNYAMQFAGSFFDQKLFFRKTNNSAGTAWNRVVNSADAGNTSGYLMFDMGGVNGAAEGRVDIAIVGGQLTIKGYNEGGTFLGTWYTLNGVSNAKVMVLITNDDVANCGTAKVSTIRIVSVSNNGGTNSQATDMGCSGSDGHNQTYFIAFNPL